jgi:hypothetical protein
MCMCEVRFTKFIIIGDAILFASLRLQLEPKTVTVCKLNILILGAFFVVRFLPLQTAIVIFFLNFDVNAVVVRTI